MARDDKLCLEHRNTGVVCIPVGHAPDGLWTTFILSFLAPPIWSRPAVFVSLLVNNDCDGRTHTVRVGLSVQPAFNFRLFLPYCPHWRHKGRSSNFPL